MMKLESGGGWSQVSEGASAIVHQPIMLIGSVREEHFLEVMLV